LLGWKVRLVVTAILLGGEWFPTRYRLGYRHTGRDSGDARPKWAQTKTKTKRIGATRQRGGVTHRVTHSIHSCANHCGSHPSTEGGWRELSTGCGYFCFPHAAADPKL